MFANYHTHTTRCGHAIGSDREYIEAAIRGGLKVLGFADHCPWIFPDDHVSGCRMAAGLIDDYFTSLVPLKKEYERDITVYIGLESEYLPDLMEDQDRLLSDYPLDYMILGQHFLEREPLSAYTGFPTEDESDLALYVDLVIEGLSGGRYSYVAHPDLLHFTGNDKIYELHMRRLCEFCRDNGYPLEINMLGAMDRRHYPSDRFMSIAGSVGCTAIIGADAHSPDRLENKEGERLCRSIADRFGLTLVDELPGLGSRL